MCLAMPRADSENSDLDQAWVESDIYINATVMQVINATTIAGQLSVI